MQKRLSIFKSGQGTSALTRLTLIAVFLGILWGLFAIMFSRNAINRINDSPPSAAAELEQSREMSQLQPPPLFDEAQVIRVIDGDTIDVLINGVQHRVDYILVDAPDVEFEEFGPESLAFNQRLVSGQNVRLERDKLETNEAGHLLRYVYVGDTMVNMLLISQGLAQVRSVAVNTKYLGQFQGLESSARAARLGIWRTYSIPEEPVPAAPSVDGDA